MADTKGVPRYDPKKHADEDGTLVLVEMFADNGELFRRVDPVEVIRPDAEEWVARMEAAGAQPASAQWAINARSGTPPEDGTEGAADHTDTKVRAWPFEAAVDTFGEWSAPDESPEG